MASGDAIPLSKAVLPQAAEVLFVPPASWPYPVAFATILRFNSVRGSRTEGGRPRSAESLCFVMSLLPFCLRPFEGENAGCVFVGCPLRMTGLTGELK
jgi:hypothetical protein